MIVDSHCHASPVWYEPAETLLFQMDRNGVERAVLVQLLGQFDNGYQQACVRRHPDRLASVGAVDPAAPDALEDLERLAEGGASGVRLRPNARSPGDDPLAIWRAAEALHLAVSCVGTTAMFTSSGFEALVEAVPRLPIVLEHLGGLARPDAESGAEVRERVFALSGHPNLSLKLPGLGQLDAQVSPLPASGAPLQGDGRGLLRDAVERFGPARCMWGSDFPPVATREGYGNALAWTRDALAGLGDNGLAAVFGGTAVRVFAPRT